MNKKKNIIILSIVIIVILGITIYYFNDKSKLSSTDTTVDEISTSVNLDTSDEDIDWSKYDVKDITLNDSITITESGVYNLSGEITNGLITINTDGNVKLNLNGVTITNSSGPAIYVESSNTVVINTIEGTTNTLSDGSTYTSYDEDVEGAIYSKDDLVLEGNGTLVVTGNKGDAIVCKDDLKINSGTYNITAKDDAIRGTDSVYILDGTFEINADGDGIKSTKEQDETKGYVKIVNGTFNITAKFDGIQVETKLLIDNGEFNITTGGGSSNSSQKSGWGNWQNSNISSDSAKGLKAGDNIVITGGTFNLNTSDDAIHSNNYVGISGGEFKIASGDDGIHADTELVIDNGDIDITNSYEGLEAKTITINNGNINIVSSDDGINAAGGNDGSGFNRPGANINSSDQSTFTINGGTIYVNASGDGLDSNGNIYINGGNIIVDGPTDNGNGALDYDSELKITDGTLIAIGSSGMAQGISTSSTQYGVLINFTSNYNSGSVISIVDSNNNEILSYTANKSFSSIAFSSSKLEKGATYTVKINGSEYQTFTINSISTTVGSSQGQGMMPRGDNNRGGHR